MKCKHALQRWINHSAAAFPQWLSNLQWGSRRQRASWRDCFGRAIGGCCQCSHKWDTSSCCHAGNHRLFACSALCFQVSSEDAPCLARRVRHTKCIACLQYPLHQPHRLQCPKLAEIFRNESNDQSKSHPLRQMTEREGDGGEKPKYCIVHVHRWLLISCSSQQRPQDCLQ